MVKFEKRQATLLVLLSGELTFTNATETKEEIKARLTLETTRIVLEISALNLIDSSGVGVIISLLRRMEGKNVILACPQPKVARIFAITRLDQIVPMFATLEEALQHEVA